MSETLIERMDRMWKNMDAMFNYPLLSGALPKLENRGLKPLIRRPHNLITKKNDKGTVTGWALELPYTPFKRDEVSIEVKGYSLVVSCGTENKVKDEELDFAGISYQKFSFSIPLPEDVDVKAITAKADDGMLRIELPAKAVVDADEEDVLKIEVK
nr:MAG TPA: hypothetical protein [Caudoviricetes sp.]